MKTPIIYLFVVAALGQGCVRRYSQPNADEPHAVVELRVIHHAAIGPELEEGVMINDNGIEFPVSAASPRQSVVRVRPEPTEYSFETEYFHTDQRVETYMATESYNCGGYYNGRTYVNRTCTRSVPRQRVVTFRVPHGDCAQATSHNPQVGGSYIVQYDFYGASQCTIQCFRQLTDAAGQTQMVQCGQDESFVSGVTTGGGDSAGTAPAGGQPAAQPAGGAQQPANGGSITPIGS